MTVAQISLPPYSEPACTRCGSTTLVVARGVQWVCYNRVACEARQAAKAGAR